MSTLPARFGKYELLERIATGGMAEVFLARSFGVEGFEKRLVIKRILPELARSPRFVSLFIQEAKVCAGLAHPNLVQIFELGRVADDHYIAMEYIHGRDLARINRTLRGEGGRMPLPLAVYVAASLLRGLAYAHARTDIAGRPLGLVHRDVSPQNVLVTFQGDVKLVDFGIAHLIGDERRPDGKAGKQAYMSPEQATGGVVDGRSDVFSTGVVLYELLTGRRPFAQLAAAERLRALQAGELPDPRSLNPEIPTRLCEILSGMLAWDPDQRPSADLAEEDLRAFLFSAGLRADAPEMGVFLRGSTGGDLPTEPAILGVAGMAQDLTHLGTVTPAEADRPARPLQVGPEQKPVVVLVGEVTGLTELSAVFGTEEVTRRHFELIRRIRRVVDPYGGVLERYQDDTFVVFWGVHRTSAHDLDRALAAGHALLRGMRLLARRGLSVGLCMGIHRGDLAVSPSRGRGFRYLARGDTVKLAHRLCLEAAVGQVLVSPAVAHASTERFSFEPGPLIHRKGHTTPIQSAVLGARHPQVRATQGRWVRRGAEIEVLREALTSLANGDGGVVLIEGAAGMGKSRLLREVRDSARTRGVPFYGGRAEPFAGDLPFLPFRDLAAAVLGLEGGWDAAGVRERLERLRQIGLSDPDLAIFGALFGVDIGLPVEPSQEAVVGAGTRLVRGLARQGPVIMALEDVQNLDPNERRLIAPVLRAIPHTPVLFLLTSQGPLPEALGAPRWSVHLDPMPLEGIELFVADLLGASAVEPGLLGRLARTAEGNPFYLRELVVALQQAGRVAVEAGCARLVAPEQDLHLPPALEGLVAARVDALPAEPKAALQVAAVLGSSFSPALLREAAGLDDPMDALDALKRHGLVIEEISGLEGRFSFSSPLVMRVVLRSILDGQRRTLHGRAAEALARLYAGQLEPHHQALAEHNAEAGRHLAAARHAVALGEQLARQQLLVAAADWWERGIAWVEAATRAGEDADAAFSLETGLRLRAGEAWALIGNADRAERNLRVALDLAEETCAPEVEARALLALGRLYLARGRLDLARVHLEMALGLSGEETDAPALRGVATEALEALAMLALDAGANDEARARCEEALSAARGDDALIGRALLVMATGLLRGGQDAAALHYLHRALQKADQSGDRILSGRVINNVGIAHYNAGRYPEALDRFRRALEIRQGLGYHRGAVVNLHNIGDTHLRMGEPARAWAAFRQSRELAAEMGWERGEVMNDAFLAYLEGCRSLGNEDWTGLGAAPQDAEINHAIARIQAAALQAEKLSDMETSVVARGLLGRLLGRLDRYEEARVVLENALALALRLEDRFLVRDMEEALGALLREKAEIAADLGA